MLKQRSLQAMSGACQVEWLLSNSIAFYSLTKTQEKANLLSLILLINSPLSPPNKIYVVVEVLYITVSTLLVHTVPVLGTFN